MRCSRACTQEPCGVSSSWAMACERSQSPRAIHHRASVAAVSLGGGAASVFAETLSSAGVMRSPLVGRRHGRGEMQEQGDEQGASHGEGIMMRQDSLRPKP